MNKTHHILIILLFCTNILCGQQHTDSSRIVTLIDSSHYFQEKNNWSKSLTFALKAQWLAKGNAYSNYNAIKSLSHILWHLGSERDAIDYLYKAIHIITNQKGRVFFDNALDYGTIGSYHLKNNQTDSSIVAFKNGIDILEQLDNPLFLSSAYNNLGLAYHKSNKKSKALNTFNKALNILDFNNTDQLKFSATIKGNLGTLFVELKEYNRAIILLYDAIDVLKIHGRQSKWDKLLGTYFKLIEAKYKVGDTLDLNAIIDSAYANLNKVIDRKYAYKKAKDIAKIHLLLKPNNHRATEKLLYFNDSLTALIEKQTNDVAFGLSQYKSSILEQQKLINILEQKEIEASLELEKAKSRRFQLFTLLILIFSAAITWLIWLNQKRKKEHIEYEKNLGKLELENQRLIKNEMSMEIAQKKSDLLQLALENSKKLDWNNELMNRIRAMRRAGRDDIDKLLKDIEIEMAQQLATDNKRAVLQVKVDEINQEFKDNLKKGFPSLSLNEIELCAYLKLGLSGQDIALIRNVEPKSITKAKQRLKKKMNLDPEQDLALYVQYF